MQKKGGGNVTKYIDVNLKIQDQAGIVYWVDWIGANGSFKSKRFDCRVEKLSFLDYLTLEGRQLVGIRSALF